MTYASTNMGEARRRDEKKEEKRARNSAIKGGELYGQD